MNQTIPLYTERLAALRALLKDMELDGFLVPMQDEFQNEYVAPCDKRIKFLSGFTGSAGFILVLMDQALFFTDSRYTLQAEDQLPRNLYTIFDTAEKMPSEWMEEHLLPRLKIGFDPRLHTARQIERLEVVALKKKAGLVPVQENPLDALWRDRPERPLVPIVAHDEIYAGKSSPAKRRELAESLVAKKINAVVITDPASVAWLLNVRGGDVPHTPLPLSSVILRSDATADWFVDPRKVPEELPILLGPDVRLSAFADFPAALKRLGEAGVHVMVDPASSSFHVVSLLRQGGAVLEQAEDPCALPRACKNATELEGMRNAHRRDGAALVKFLAWLDSRIDEDASITEIDVEEKLTSLRAEGSLYQGPSFATIAGSGPNGAIVHYRAKPETCRTLEKGTFLLLDSGAQYLDGTTDVTRTIPLGAVSKEMKDRYTRVLKGHIAMATIKFPAGTGGSELDVLARQYLWAEGLDYGHGTGHGVGSYLCVHEGPQSLSRRSQVALKPSMVLSNEPGYYKARHYGIRLENLQFVTEPIELPSGDVQMLGFEPLTLAPFDRRAIDMEMLTSAEKAWLNAYHARVCKTLRPQLDEATNQWLEQATATL